VDGNGMGAASQLVIDNDGVTNDIESLGGRHPAVDAERDSNGCAASFN